MNGPGSDFPGAPTGKAALTAGNEARDRRDWDAAARHYRSYLVGRPAAFAIWVQCGHALKESGRLVEALVAYSRALGLNDRDADLWLNFGHLYKRMGLREDSISSYRRSFAIDGNSHARSELEGLGAAEDRVRGPALGVAPARRKPLRARAISVLNALNPAARRRLEILRRGNAARDRREWAAAAHHYERYLQDRPDHFAIWVQLGHARKESGWLEGAVQAYEGAYKLDPHDADLLLNFGHLYKVMGKRDLAISFFRRSAERDGNVWALDELRHMNIHALAASPDSLSSPVSGQPKITSVNPAPASTLNWPDELDPAPLFDAVWYAKHYPDVAHSDKTAFQHYVEVGANRGYSPHPLFDADWYLRLYPDVAKAGLNPLAHFLNDGARENRNPNPLFDTAWYLSANPDVANSGMNALCHFILFGAAEARSPHPLFDTKWYCLQYPEAAQAGGNPLTHYLTVGQAAGNAKNSLEFARTQGERR